MSLREQYLRHMAGLTPEIDELPGDLQLVATALEQKVPGLGACLAMHLADELRCNIYLRNYDGMKIKHRDKWILSVKDTCHDDGKRVTIKEIAMAIGEIRTRRVEAIIWEDNVKSQQLSLWNE